jgi:hypothetical protein
VNWRIFKVAKFVLIYFTLEIEQFLLEIRLTFQSKVTFKENSIYLLQRNSFCVSLNVIDINIKFFVLDTFLWIPRISWNVWRSVL